ALAAPLLHGGDLATARRLFPGAAEPFIDLSTGINPYPYPAPALSADALTRLPEPAALERLAMIAAHTYGAPSAAHVVAAPGMQSMLSHIASLQPPGLAAVLSPTYSEHARALKLAGHQVIETNELERLTDVDLAVIVNPNNPDGRLIPA